MKRLFALLLAVAMMLALVSLAAAAEEIAITIPHYKSGENVGARFFLPQVERFNEKYAGKYKVIIEELTQDIYSEKMQQLAIQKQLPPLIEGGTAEWLSDVVVPNELFLNLSDFLKEYPEVDEQIPDFQRAYNTTADGKFVSVSYNVVRPMGFYYNTEMAPLPKEPGAYADWDAFLADFGDNKFALMTGENAWTSALVLSSMIAQEGGVELLKEHATVENLLGDYNDPAIVNAFTRFKAFYDKHASSNAVGAVYADAANNFMSKGSAAIANGSWMVSDFLKGSEDKWSNGFDGAVVRGAVFPGNIAVSNLTGSYGWWIPNTATAEQQEAAKAFLGFMLSKPEIEAYCLAEGGNPITWGLSDEAFAKMAETNPLMASYVGAADADTTYVPNILDVMPSSVANTGFGSLLPLLLDGTYTPEQFAQQLTQTATDALTD